MSDGEFQEGQTWEAINALCFHRLGSVGVYVDANGQQCDGRMDSVCTIEPLAARLEAFGAHVREVDGHDVEALAQAGEAWPADRPLVVIARTDPCRGLEVLRRRAPRLHYVRFAGDEERHELERALEQLKEETRACSG
jgi:transketolase